MLNDFELQNFAIQEVIIQPTTFCNINCRYCYLPNRTDTKRMSASTLEKIFEAVFSSSLTGDTIKIVWHAGEPMTLPISFYEEAFAILKQMNRHNVKVISTFQTNGTLITQQWCDFIKKHHIKMSVSVDGPQFLHDLHRIDRAGRGTFERTMRGIRLLQKNGIDPAIIMVLTRQALDYPDEIWQFLIENQFRAAAFLLEELLGSTHQMPLNESDDRDRYITFLKRILQLRSECENPPFIREIDLLMERIKHLVHPVHSQANVPMAIINFDYEGNMSTFSPELLTLSDPRYNNFLFGNANENRIEDMLTNEKFNRVLTQVQRGVTKCQETCEYFVLCGGGSPANKLHENGIFESTETELCKLKVKATVDTVLEHMEKTT